MFKNVLAVTLVMTGLSSIACSVGVLPETEESDVEQINQQLPKEVIIVTGEAPPDCRKTNGAGYDNVYDSHGNWSGCTCTFGCGHGGPSEPPRGGVDSDDDGPGGGAESEHHTPQQERLSRLKNCLHNCKVKQGPASYSCIRNGRSGDSGYCPVARPDGRCPGAREICRLEYESPWGTLPIKCRNPLSSAADPVCQEEQRACEAGWLESLHPRARRFRDTCRDLAESQAMTCSITCLKGLGNNMLCDASSEGSGVDNGRIDGDSGWCCNDQSCWNCATDDVQCKYGTDAL